MSSISNKILNLFQLVNIHAVTASKLKVTERFKQAVALLMSLYTRPMKRQGKYPQTISELWREGQPDSLVFSPFSYQQESWKSTESCLLFHCLSHQAKALWALWNSIYYSYFSNFTFYSLKFVLKHRLFGHLSQQHKCKLLIGFWCQHCLVWQVRGQGSGSRAEALQPPPGPGLCAQHLSSFQQWLLGYFGFKTHQRLKTPKECALGLLGQELKWPTTCFSNLIRRVQCGHTQKIYSFPRSSINFSSVLIPSLVFGLFWKQRD